jgi:Uma2 family endonuclease
MGETDDHRDQMVRHIELLRYYYRGQRVYVSGNLLVYYEQGNPKKCVVPDAFVVKDMHVRNRRIYKLWVEGKPPEVVIETTSRKTRKTDTEEKPKLYARLGVREYFLYDPIQEYLDPPLQGYRLSEDGYVRLELDTTRSLVSEELGLRLRVEENLLQFYRLDTGERLLTAEERMAREVELRRQETEGRQREAEARQREAEARQREAAARQAAEAEVARLRAELARRSQASPNE